MTDTPNRRDLLERLLPIARAAGDMILEVYRTDFDIRGKSDDSPVTAQPDMRYSPPLVVASPTPPAPR